jgi:hypothetical protein
MHPFFIPLIFLVLHVSANIYYLQRACVPSKSLVHLILSWVKFSRWMEVDYYCICCLMCGDLLAYVAYFPTDCHTSRQ